MNDSYPMPRVRFLCVQLVTFMRIPLSVAYAAVLLRCDLDSSVLIGCLSLLIASESTDLLDGLLARRLGVASEWGEVFDPFVDSVSRLSVFGALAAQHMVPLFVPVIMVLRDLIVAYSRVICAVNGTHVAANWSGKIKAVVQGVGATGLTVLGFIEHRDETSLVLISGIIAVITLISSFQYIIKALRSLRTRITHD